MIGQGPRVPRQGQEELAAAGATLLSKFSHELSAHLQQLGGGCQIVAAAGRPAGHGLYRHHRQKPAPRQRSCGKCAAAAICAAQVRNWGPDYADPETYTDPFRIGTNYNFPEYAPASLDEEYHALVDAAKAITDDIPARYEAFARAEAFYINNAFVIPFGYGSGGYTATRLNPFESQFAPYGLSNERYKGQKIMDKPMSTDMYFEAYDNWLAEREALADKAK